MPTAGGCWINMRGSFGRCAREQLRPATNDESIVAELVNRCYLSDPRLNVQHNWGPKKYVDVRAEGHPVFPDNGDDAELPESVPSDDEALARPWEPEGQPGSGSRGTEPLSEPAPPHLDPNTPSASARAIQREAGAGSRARSRTPPPSPSRDVDNDLSTAQPGTLAAQLFRQTPFAPPFVQVSSNVSHNHYIGTNHLNQFIEGSETFLVSEAMAEFVPGRNHFTFKKKPEDAEVRIDDLPTKVRSCSQARAALVEGNGQTLSISSRRKVDQL